MLFKVVLLPTADLNIETLHAEDVISTRNVGRTGLYVTAEYLILSQC